jgi:hypothetical protein
VIGDAKMSRLLIARFALLASLFHGVTVVAQTAETSKAAATATLRGRVAAAASGQPLRRALVRIMAMEVAVAVPLLRSTTTDASGRYEFTDLPAGRYIVMASKGGYVQLSYGQTRSSEPGKPVEILVGRTIEDIDFALPAGAVITGRVVDEFGDPADEAVVTILRSQNFEGGRRLVPIGVPVVSNDLGEFRLFGISPGQYYLSATASNRVVDPPPDTGGPPNYSTTYFPSTTDPAEAQRVSIGIGQTISEVVIALVPTIKVRITGTVVDSQGRPMTGQVLMLARDGSSFAANPIRSDGSFTIDRVTAGTYTLQATGPSEERASTEITVGSGNVDGIRLVGANAVTVTGRVILDAVTASSVRPGAIEVLATPAQSAGTPFGGAVRPVGLNDDLTFELKVWPGKARLVLTNTPPGWTMRSVRYRHVDVTDNGIEFKPGEHITGVEIELTDKLTNVVGLVTDGRGESVTDYWVLVFPHDRDRWMTGSRYIQSGRPDQNGRFRVSGLPPGEYSLIALDRLDDADSRDPEFLDRVRKAASSFTLMEAETKTFDLRLNAGP